MTLQTDLSFMRGNGEDWGITSWIRYSRISIHSSFRRACTELNLDTTAPWRELFPISFITTLMEIRFESLPFLIKGRTRPYDGSRQQVGDNKAQQDLPLIEVAVR